MSERVKLPHTSEYIMRGTSNGWGEYVGELTCCSDCKYDHECTHIIVRESKGGGNAYFPVYYCSEGKRKEE